MKLGVIYPQVELSGSPEAFHSLGVAVESLGYDHLVMYDHVLGASHENRDPPLLAYNENDPFHDPLVAFGYLAALTRRIELVTGVLILPQRQTALVARQAADVDLLSGGRLCLGVGTGWNYVEYDALGEDFHTRGRKLDEQIPYLRRLWSEHVVSFEGRFDRIDRANLMPRPRRQIPIYCGGMVKAAYDRAARLADGFIFAAGFDDETLAAWDYVRDQLRANGRSPDGFGRHFILQDFTGKVRPVDEFVDRLCRLRDAGATEVSVSSMARGFRETDEHLDFFAQIKARADARKG
jgi:probable F420-dependent oxidoreductase